LVASIGPVGVRMYILYSSAKVKCHFVCGLRSPSDSIAIRVAVLSRVPCRRVPRFAASQCTVAWLSQCSYHVLSRRQGHSSFAFHVGRRAITIAFRRGMLGGGIWLGHRGRCGGAEHARHQALLGLSLRCVLGFD